MGLLKSASLINFSIRTKLLLIYLLCVLVPTLVFSLAISLSSMKSTRNEKLILYRQALERIGASIETNAISAIELSNIIYPDEAMYEHINNEYTNRKKVLDDYNKYLKNVWNKILPYDTNIVLFTIYTGNNSLLNARNLHRIDRMVIQNEWYVKYHNQASKALFISHSDELIVGSARTKLISYIRKLDYMDNAKFEHFLKITFRADMLDKILKTENIPGKIYIVDSKNYIAAQSNMLDNKYGGARLLSFDTIKIDSGQSVIKIRLKAMDGWQVICLLDKDFLNDELKMNWIQISILILSTTIFASAIIWAISSSLYKRIDIIVEHMSKVELGEYAPILANNEGNDEIGLLISSLNKMTAKISMLIEDVYKAKIRETQMELLKKQSEINALQCQVNPHFMFNVLETVRIKAYLRNEFETARIVKYMSKIFRKLLLWNDDLIELQEELSFIKEYLEIQQYRYEDELEFEITADESILSLRIPKMTLQTFVDNACEHGFSETNGLRKVKITAALSENRAEMRVYDNGKGMKSECINNLSQLGSNSIGIKNVLARLGLYYGEKFDFRINSKLGEFTEIILTLDLEKTSRCNHV